MYTFLINKEARASIRVTFIIEIMNCLVYNTKVYQQNQAALWICVFVCVCMYMCACVCVCIYMCMCVCVCVCIYIYIYICVCVCVCVCSHACARTHSRAHCTFFGGVVRGMFGQVGLPAFGSVLKFLK